MPTLILNTVAVEVADLNAAEAAWEAWAANRSLSARTYKEALLLDDHGNLVGYFSMNGRYWTRETTLNNWDMMMAREWGARIQKATAKVRK